MSAEVRYCAYCDQPVEEIPKGKEWTTGSGHGEFKHKSSSFNGVAFCGRQFLYNHETYTVENK